MLFGAGALCAFGLWLMRATSAALDSLRVDAGLTALVNQGTAEAVQTQLQRGPLAVHARTGSALRGPYPQIETGDVQLHFQLYHEARRARAHGPLPPTSRP